jgi:hypothetical protein
VKIKNLAANQCSLPSSRAGTYSCPGLFLFLLHLVG